MSAEVLRAAAGLMRARAESATPGPWETATYDSGLSFRCLDASVVTVDMGDLIAVVDYDGDAGGPHAEEGADAEHIASWHPAVALAVADWLGAAYAAWLASENSLSAASVRAMSGEANNPDRHAIAVARAYLGSDA